MLYKTIVSGSGGVGGDLEPCLRCLVLKFIAELQTLWPKVNPDRVRIVIFIRILKVFRVQSIKFFSQNFSLISRNLCYRMHQKSQCTSDSYNFQINKMT